MPDFKHEAVSVEAREAMLTPNAQFVTARALVWLIPDDDTLGLSDDCAVYAIGLGGNYSVSEPTPVRAIHGDVGEDKTVMFEGQRCFKPMLWWAHDPFSFTVYETMDEAKLAAEADWQTRFRGLIASAPPSAALRSDEQRAGWRPEYTKAPLAFCDGVITLNRDGSGQLSFRDDDLDWGFHEDNDHRFINLPASEIAAIRNHLNKYAPPADAPKVEKCPDCGRDVLGENKAATGFMANCGRRLARLEQCRAGGCTADAPAVSGEGK